MDADADVLEARVFDGQAAGPGDVLAPRQDGGAGIAEGNALEILIIRAHDIEQHLVVIAVEDDPAVAGRLDGNGFVRRAALRQVIGAVPGGAATFLVVGVHFVAVVETVVFIGPGVDQDGVARLHARQRGVAPVTADRSHVIGRQQAAESRLLPGACVTRRIDVVHVSAGIGHGFGARVDGYTMLFFTADAVRIRDGETYFVPGCRCQVENTAGEHIRGRVIDGPGQEGAFTMQPQQRQSPGPFAVAGPAVLNIDGGIAVGIAVDIPFETERDQGGGFDHKLTGSNAVLFRVPGGVKREWKKEKDGSQGYNICRSAMLHHPSRNGIYFGAVQAAVVYSLSSNINSCPCSTRSVPTDNSLSLP